MGIKGLIHGDRIGPLFLSTEKKGVFFRRAGLSGAVLRQAVMAKNRGVPIGRAQNTPEFQMVIRRETVADIEKITEVTIAAFRTLASSNHTEPFIINALRAADALAISLVAEADGKMVGHIAFSPVTVSDGAIGWYGLGPVSVLPEHQKKGIGKALIHEGLSLLKKMDGRGCVLVGHPAYYTRLGFRNFPELIHEGVPQEVFFALPFTENVPKGIVGFHEGFLANG